MDVNELKEQFPILMKILCENPETARMLENNKAGIFRIVEVPVVHNDGGERRIEYIRKAPSAFEASRLDPR